MYAYVYVPDIARPVPIIINRLQQLERMVVDVSEASETRVSNEWHGASHYHPQHIPCRREGTPERHQPFTYTLDRGDYRDDILHPLHTRLERCSGLLIDLLKPVLHLIQDRIVSVNRMD